MEASLAVPCFRVGYTITTDKLDAFYKQVKPKGVTMTTLLKAVAVTLARHPQVNAATTASGMAYPADVNGRGGGHGRRRADHAIASSRPHRSL